MLAALRVHEWLPVALVAAAALVYTVKVALELMGKAPGAALLRDENHDLLRRNGELESTTARHEETIRAQGDKIIRLEEQVRALEKLDQSAVLKALRDHEVGAEARAEKTQQLLSESTSVLERIATSLSGP